MAGRIRGITIEIGGDTAKLDKALKGTNTQIKSTQGQLKDVERLLKLDPKNTELLAQKQRLLAEAVSGTKNKLETLKAAAVNADQALANNAEWEAKYKPLKEEIDQTNAKMKELKTQDTEMKAQLDRGEISTEKYEAFQTEMQETKEKMASLREAKTELDQSFAEGHIDQYQYDALQREIVETEQSLKKLEEQSGKSSNAMAKLGDVAGNVSDKARRASDATKGLSLAAGGVLVAMGGLAYSVGQTADEINTLAKQTGLSTTQIQEFMYASDLIDVSMETLTGSMSRLTRNMATAQKGTGDAAVAFRELGIQIENQDGSLRDNQAVFTETIKRLGQIENVTQRDAYAMQIFGKSAQELNPLILGGADALEEYAKQAHEAGLILSQETLDGANEFNDSIDKLKAEAGAMMMELGAKIAAILLPVLDVLSDKLGGILDWMRSLDEGQIKLIGTIVMLVALISPVARIISAVSSAISGVSGAIGAVSKAGNLFSDAAGSKVYATFAKWALIIMAVVLAVTLLIAAINVLMGKGDQMDKTLSGIGGAASSRPNIPAYATGTNYHTGGYALVGEVGPELVSMPRGSRVYSAQDTRNLMNEGNVSQPTEIRLKVIAGDSLARDLSFQVEKASQLRGIKLVKGV